MRLQQFLMILNAVFFSDRHRYVRPSQHDVLLHRRLEGLGLEERAPENFPRVHPVRVPPEWENEDRDLQQGEEKTLNPNGWHTIGCQKDICSRGNGAMDQVAACGARGPEFDPSFIRIVILLSGLRLLDGTRYDKICVFFHIPIIELILKCHHPDM